MQNKNLIKLKSIDELTRYHVCLCFVQHTLKAFQLEVVCRMSSVVPITLSSQNTMQLYLILSFYRELYSINVLLHLRNMRVRVGNYTT